MHIRVLICIIVHEGQNNKYSIECVCPQEGKFFRSYSAHDFIIQNYYKRTGQTKRSSLKKGMIQASIRSLFTYICFLQFPTILGYSLVIIITHIIYNYPENVLQNVTDTYKQVRVLSC